jgi:magnesium chelatase family protein
MAPADLRKEGSAYDLTLTIGILVASQQITAVDIDKYIIMGSFLSMGVYNPFVEPTYCYQSEGRGI